MSWSKAMQVEAGLTRAIDEKKIGESQFWSDEEDGVPQCMVAHGMDALGITEHDFYAEVAGRGLFLEDQLGEANSTYTGGVFRAIAKLMGCPTKDVVVMGSELVEVATLNDERTDPADRRETAARLVSLVKEYVT